MTYQFYTYRKVIAFINNNEKARLIAWPYGLQNIPYIVFIPRQQQR